MAERQQNVASTRRERKKFTADERSTLLSIFWTRGQYLKPEEADALGHRMDRSRQQILQFFDNQRKRIRRAQRAAVNATSRPTRAQTPADDTASRSVSITVASPEPQRYYESFLAALLDDSWPHETKPVTRAWLQEMVINNPHAMELMDNNYHI